MKVVAAKNSPAKADADVVILGVYESGEATSAVAELDQALGGTLKRLREKGELTGRKNETTILPAPTGVKALQVVVIGLGEKSKVDAGIVFRAAASAAKAASGKARARVVCSLDDSWPNALHEQAVAGVIYGCQGQDLYRAEKKQFEFGELQYAGGDKASLANGQIIGDSLNLTRRLINEPADVMYPAAFAVAAQKMAKEHDLACEVWDEKRLEREKCGSLLAVAKGSSRPPRLVILRHNGGKKKDPLLALVGKGVTFDSGGLSLKPSDSMLTMKCDKSGAATVVGVMHAIARLKLPLNVVGLIGLVENMTGPAAYKLGDVLTARSGKTIEVHNTDAEGRLVLADVLDVACDELPDRIIDLATLTGACMVALGADVTGAMTNDQAWCETILRAAQSAGEPVWQLPMFPEYGEQIKSEVADIKNVGEGRWGGAITAAKFLEEFVRGIPWTHLDIAGPAFAEKPKPGLAGGATGCFVRALIGLARSWNQ